jgi:hypothetical protein
VPNARRHDDLELPDLRWRGPPATERRRIHRRGRLDRGARAGVRQRSWADGARINRPNSARAALALLARGLAARDHLLQLAHARLVRGGGGHCVVSTASAALANASNIMGSG